MTIAVRTSQTPGSCSSTRTCRPANSLPSEICPFEPTILTLVLVARVSICNLRALSLPRVARRRHLSVCLQWCLNTARRHYRTKEQYTQLHGDTLFGEGIR